MTTPTNDKNILPVGENAFKVFTNGDLVKHIADFQSGIKYKDWTSAEKACENGYFEMIKDKHTQLTGWSPKCMDLAARNGHLDVVKHLHTKLRIKGTTNALDWAAKNGHLDVLVYFHTVVKSKCSPYVMDLVAKNGHMDTLVYLHTVVKASYSHMAMNYAAGNGHLDVIEYLHKTRTEGHTKGYGMALDWATRAGRLNIVKFLCRTMTVEESTFEVRGVESLFQYPLVIQNCYPYLMKSAVSCGHFDIVEFLQ